MNVRYFQHDCCGRQISLWQIKGMKKLQSFQILFRSCTRSPTHTSCITFQSHFIEAHSFKLYCWMYTDALLMSFLFMEQNHLLFSFHSGYLSYSQLLMNKASSVNILVMPLCCQPAPNKKAGSLDMEYPWPVTQRWPEEVMSGENVPGPARQTDGHVGRGSLFLPGIS